MLPTHPVPCPHCGGELFSATSLEDGVNAEAPQAPKVEHDQRGDFMHCPHCRARVGLRRLHDGGADAVQVSGESPR
jgi:DNA-directed RNA polymerase subunit RPC12/RpoP